MEMTKCVSKSSLVSFPACDGTWRAMNSTLTAVFSRGRTKEVCVGTPTKTTSPLTCVLQPPCTLTGCDTAGAGQHRLIRSEHHRGLRTSQSHRMVYHPSYVTGPGPVVHPASRSVTSPAPSVTVMIRPADDERYPEGRSIPLHNLSVAQKAKILSSFPKKAEYVRSCL
jgi:hypothetical protein